MPEESGSKASSRVWQACIACRRKKVKCDGNNPCHNCSSREVQCEFPGSNDNASSSRSYGQMFDTHCQQLDSFCDRLEGLAGQLVHAVESLAGDRRRPSSHQLAEEELRQAAHALQSIPRLGNGPPTRPHVEFGANTLSDHQDGASVALHTERNDPDESSGDGDSGGQSDAVSTSPYTFHEPPAGGFGSLVADSYGRLRFIGGAANSMLVEAVQKLTPGQSLESNASALDGSPGENISSRNDANSPLEIPLFVHGQKWPELPYLPKAEQLSRPPQYVADLLVGLYFDQFHYTFPVLYKPHFMAQYNLLGSTRKEKVVDKRFMSVFFAVCACASSLIPSEGTPSKFPGRKYYEKALLLHFAGTGEASVERVQCLALLAMCCAGWNTLSTSWSFAGQAVRTAQDLGMHLSGLMPAQEDSERSSSNILRQEISRRVWWSVYCLDRVTSICLGRPMAAHDSDCLCTLPLPVADEDLLSACQDEGTSISQPVSALPLTGFLAFAKLCQISGKVQRLHSPSRLAGLGTPGEARRTSKLVMNLDKSLREWLSSLPDEIRFAANTLQRGPNLKMCVIMFIVHAGTLLNLYRTLAGAMTLSPTGVDPIPQCVSAARSCINAAELVRELVPPSHHLAFCVHYLTLSGLALLQMKEHTTSGVEDDIDKCIEFLKELEVIWSGASRGRAIIQKLREDSRKRVQGPSKEWETYDALFHMPGLEMFNLEQFGNDSPSTWGWHVGDDHVE